MKRVITLILLGLVAGCGSQVTPNQVNLPPDALNYGGIGAGYSAIDFAAYVFADPARARGRPGAAAGAVASLEYMASDMPGNPRWVIISPLVLDDLVRARAEVRNALGISQAVPAQTVVDGLLASARGLDKRDDAAVRAALQPPVFTWGPDRTVERLANMPYLQIANSATLRASQQQYEHNDHCFLCR
ncbi:hypothetical protein [Limobrevibacterium gyesilva]|uniref:Lipoprotein n=1 Tax=Limobrevibacterium gyesilva TaxID=2991712 RepID=A0AA42CE87_9PROT|nr:hypothetical protein [Limobrevibacterium gyesilva]MCW3474964.1 hypothetical protein [Limobrevibacterium gyesilva]